MADSTQCQCRCVSDDGLCPHDEYSNQKFHVCWDDIEKSIDQILCHYSRDDIRAFIDIDSIKHSKVNEIATKNTKASMERYSAQLTKVFHAHHFAA
jgi:hypothetical protein